MAFPSPGEWFKALWDWIIDLGQAIAPFIIYVYDTVIGGLTWAVKFALFTSFWDLSLWIGTTSIILLATSELLSPHYGRTGILLDKKRMRLVALALCTLFVFIVAVQVYSFVLTLAQAR